MGNPLIIAISAAAVLIGAVGDAGPEKKQPTPYIKPDPATALRKYDYNLFILSNWARGSALRSRAAASHYQALGGSLDWYRFHFRRELTLKTGQLTQQTEPILFLKIAPRDKPPTKEEGVTSVIIDLEPVETEIAQAITRTVKIEPDPQYQSPVFYCLNDYNQCISRETRWRCMPLIVLCMAQNVIPLTP